MADNEIQWGVQWEVATPPESVTTNTPVAPIPPAPDADQELQDQYAELLIAFEEAVRVHAALLDEALADPAAWQITVTVFGSEAEARQTLAEMRRVNNGNVLTRNFQLVTSPPRSWTPV
ncbi:hypothetical protein [Mycobacterium aquaticum]|uniref:Uncharacterized protein n=1 Tax=Mycobacterium aquaticum TaxID=1927124 RepID=A0A1X0B718_9MYCO|nr:hypothetical protein [Mycobacterium aquaticum]ORA38124.1 hypothetical protein BST13_05875 [Mycobacterium aquaticum]